ncbi:MAG: hypothetical protein P8Y68_08745 [Anaerolineales bacterium]
MTGQLVLDWAILALSLANTILLMWLGTTVLLNTERRTWGGWLAAAGLLLGGVFFISHTAILGFGLSAIGAGINLWWAVGLTAVTILPFLWYVMMLWYSGFWQKPTIGKNSLVRRHRIFLTIAGILVIGLLMIAIATRSSPVTGSYPTRGLEESVMINGQPLVLVMYPIYVLVCLVFSLDALNKPGPSQRRMGELARQRARPWLIGATMALVMVSLVVGIVFAWLFGYTGDFSSLTDEVVRIAWFDLLIEALIFLAVILLGQAVVAYEIFTGQTLPRRGFMRQWQRAILLSLGYGIVIGFTFSANLRPIYGVLLSALLMTFFFALLSWRMVSERQRAIANLRPFVVSERFYDLLVSPASQKDLDLGQQTPFNALCQEVLNTRLAILSAIGPLAPLVGKPLHYSDVTGNQFSKLPDQESIAGILPQLSPEVSILRMELEILPGIEWVVPLWSQRGLVGVLLLGNKRDGGIYSQEEIEIAQSIGERLLDTKASTEIAQRLIGLQRQRMAETQVLDQRARRVLHDEVLQQLHTAILHLDKGGEKLELGKQEALEMLTDVHGQISSLLRSMPGTSPPQITDFGLIGALRRLIKEEMGSAFESVTWNVPPDFDEKTSGITSLETEVLFYAAREVIRNAALHGRPLEDNRSFNLSIKVKLDPRLTIVIEDDGVGIDAQHQHPNGGQGLALHSTMMAVIGGELVVESESAQYTRVILRLP